MSDTSQRGSAITESCEACNRPTRHAVRIEFRVESRKRKNAEYSREPYRVAVCQRCGATRDRRMNDA